MCVIDDFYVLSRLFFIVIAGGCALIFSNKYSYLRFFCRFSIVLYAVAEQTWYSDRWLAMDASYSWCGSKIQCKLLVLMMAPENTVIVFFSFFLFIRMLLSMV